MCLLTFCERYLGVSLYELKFHGSTRGEKRFALSTQGRCNVIRFANSIHAHKINSNRRKRFYVNGPELFLARRAHFISAIIIYAYYTNSHNF